MTGADAPPPMMTLGGWSARLSKAGTFKAALEVMTTVVDGAQQEAQLRVSSAGLTLSSLNRPSTCLVTLDLPATEFELFQCRDLGPTAPRHSVTGCRPPATTIALGMCMAHLNTVLRCADDDACLTFHGDLCDDGILAITIEAANGTREMCVDLVLTPVSTKLPQHLHLIDHSATVTLPSRVWRRMCRNLSRFGEELQVHMPEGQWHLRGLGGCAKFKVAGRIAMANITCRHDTAAARVEEHTIVYSNERFVQTMAMDVLLAFSKAASLSETVTIGMTEDMIVVVHRVGGRESLRLHLAPRHFKETANVINAEAT